MENAVLALDCSANTAKLYSNVVLLQYNITQTHHMMMFAPEVPRCRPWTSCTRAPRRRPIVMRAWTRRPLPSALRRRRKEH